MMLMLSNALHMRQKFIMCAFSMPNDEHQEETKQAEKQMTIIKIRLRSANVQNTNLQTFVLCQSFYTEFYVRKKNNKIIAKTMKFFDNIFILYVKDLLDNPKEERAAKITRKKNISCLLQKWLCREMLIKDPFMDLSVM